MEKVKREICYIDNPYKFGIACDKCDGSNIAWSEWEGMIWCFDCEIDTEGTPGIFDGPILLNTTKLMLGVSFDQVNLETGKIIPSI